MRVLLSTRLPSVRYVKTKFFKMNPKTVEAIYGSGKERRNIYPEMRKGVQGDIQNLKGLMKKTGYKDLINHSSRPLIWLHCLVTAKWLL